MSDIRITGGKGFHLTFANGWRISVQIGPGNYSDNYDHPSDWYTSRAAELPPSSQAEIAIWGPDGNWYDFAKGQGEFGTTDVLGYVPAEEVFDWIAKVRAF